MKEDDDILTTYCGSPGQRFYYPPTKLRSEKKADRRTSAKHKWLTGKTAMDIDLLIDFVENFNARRTFGRAMEVVQAANRLEKNATKKPDNEDDEEELQNVQEKSNHNQKQAQDIETDPDFIPSWHPQPAQTPSEPVVEKSESENLADIPVENAPTPPNPAANPAPVAKKEMGKKTVSYSTTVSTSTAQIAKTTEQTNTFLTGIVDQGSMEKYEREAKEQGREDVPGHKNYVPSMIGGAFQADTAVLVISACKGEFETGFGRGGQIREHGLLVRTLGVSKLIVVINKMDNPTVCWSKAR
ncbi:5750_t:CDS:2 [Ambispora leptoticha]|uniref:5750_t:CDS:1 n=1 Tax=Ambispora leptoticha TaxID=144679 RepID=A0A9N8Z4T5_9GLOM|nr:5750_t:CDS:2 [Ambispora leptoticha]